MKRDKTPSSPQQSSEHKTTGDASTAPGSRDDAKTTRHAKSEPEHHPSKKKVMPRPQKGITVIRDETDNGGPLVIKTTDPEMKESLKDLPNEPLPGDAIPRPGNAPD